MLKTQGYVFGGSYKPKPNPFHRGEKRMQKIVVVAVLFTLAIWVVIYKLAV